MDTNQLIAECPAMQFYPSAFLIGLSWIDFLKIPLIDVMLGKIKHIYNLTWANPNPYSLNKIVEEHLYVLEVKPNSNLWTICFARVQPLAVR